MVFEACSKGAQLSVSCGNCKVHERDVIILGVSIAFFIFVLPFMVNKDVYLWYAYALPTPAFAEAWVG